MEQEKMNTDGGLFGKKVKQTGMYEGLFSNDPPQAGAKDGEETKRQQTINPFSAGTDPAQKKDPQSDSPEPETTSEGDRDAWVQVFHDNAYMVGEVVVKEPIGKGAHLTEQMLVDALNRDGIVHGLIPEALAKLLEPTYDDRIVVARGTEAIDGEDGECVDRFPRNAEKHQQEREDGSIDYRELGLINDVNAGEVICEVTPPTEGTPGSSIRGTELKPRPGKKAVLPVGEGTQAAADGTHMEAAYDGNVVFRGGRFCVDRVYRVQDVDYDVGNITFSGDVQVNGDIQDGFEIHAGGDVVLRGRVGSVVVVAGGNITIERGINGTGRAVLETPGVVKAGFIENATVHAGEKVIASSIINSKVECEGDVDVSGGKGIICGGKVTTFGSIKAREVGNESNTLTTIALGVTPNLLTERKKIVEKQADVAKHIDEMKRNIEYIEKLVAQGKPVPQDRLQLLQRSKVAMPMSENKLKQIKQTVADMDKKMAEVNNSTLTARVIHPPTKVSIGAISTNCMEIHNSCRVYKNSAGEIVFGSA